ESFRESRQRHSRLEVWRNAHQRPFALDRSVDDGCPEVQPQEPLDCQEPYSGGPLPFSPLHALSLADCYLVLALVHDAARPDGGRIDPFPSDDTQGQMFYAALKRHVCGLRQRDQLTLDDCLARVNAELGVPADANSNHGEPLAGETGHCEAETGSGDGVLTA